jgi:glycosyltransferase involved in cell wall biosynthesis
MLNRADTPEGRAGGREDILRSITIVGSYPPRQCGIATFSGDLLKALHGALPRSRVSAIAIDDIAGGYPYPPEVQFEIDQHEPADYDLAAAHLSMNKVDVVSLQHEFGIYGGTEGAHIIRFLQSLSAPIVTTLHTVLRSPTPSQLRIMQQLERLSDRLLVMCETGRALLEDVFEVPASKIEVIPHGVPDVLFLDPSYYKNRLGADGRTVLMSFGLLSPDKGYEYLIDALPRIREQHPGVMYLIVGATHPAILRQHGEAYRRGLIERARSLGVEENVVFENRFVSIDELVAYLEAADLYVTPYLKESQICSGTLAYALACGKAVVSTPYWYAAEMLGEGRGAIVPFCDSNALADTILSVLGDPQRLFAMRRAGYDLQRKAIWANVGRRHAELFRRVVEERLAHPRRKPMGPKVASPSHGLPELNLKHLRRMTDDVGMLQHARSSIPLRSEGYCTDDNARALIVATQASRIVEKPAELVDLATRYLAFVVHAFDERSGRFRNFMGYDRRWLPDPDADEPHGRALWCLGVAYAKSKDESQRTVAARYFLEGLPLADSIDGLQAIAFVLFGLDAYLERFPGDTRVKRTRALLAERMFARFRSNMTKEWCWPTDQLTYANASIPHAMLLAGRGLGRNDMVRVAIDALDWLCGVQTHRGLFEPVGNRGWYTRGEEKARFDQQPIEADATVCACAYAFTITGDRRWVAESRRAFEWFLGQNDLGIPVHDAEGGGCRDGLDIDGVNQNRGAESTLCWLTSLIRMHRLRAEGALEAPPTRLLRAQAVGG